MQPTERMLAGIGLAGHVCDAVGGLYVAYDVFRRHAGPLGVLTRSVTYSLVLAIPSWLALGLPFGAIAGCGMGLLVGFDQWKLARHQRQLRSSPRLQSAWAGAARGVVLGLACMPRYGVRFGGAAALIGASYAAAVYGAGLVPVYHPHPGAAWRPPATVLTAALLRGAALGAGAATAAWLLGGAGRAAGPGLGLELAGLVALVSVFVALVMPHVEFRIEKASDSFFVYAGLALLFCGLLCDSIPNVLDLAR